MTIEPGCARAKGRHGAALACKDGQSPAEVDFCDRIATVDEIVDR